MVTISAFADEISPDLKVQMDVLDKHNIKYIELRGINDKNVLDFAPEERRRFKSMMDERGFRISAIGSPIGKTDLRENFQEHLEKFKIAIEAAHFFGCKLIRVFSYYIPEDRNHPAFKNEVIERMAKKAEMAAEAALTLVHENEEGIFGDTPERCLEIIEGASSPALKLAFDSANFLRIGVKPYADAWPLLKEHVVHFHIKDFDCNKNEHTPAGEGDGRYKEILSAAKERGYGGYVTLEPHLALAGKMKGFTGEEKFALAANALKKILEEIQYDY